MEGIELAIMSIEVEEVTIVEVADEVKLDQGLEVQA